LDLVGVDILFHLDIDFYEVLVVDEDVFLDWDEADVLADDWFGLLDFFKELWTGVCGQVFALNKLGVWIDWTSIDACVVASMPVLLVAVFDVVWLWLAGVFWELRVIRDFPNLWLWRLFFLHDIPVRVVPLQKSAVCLFLPTIGLTFPLPQLML
jgi:hypothetical protein